MRRVILVFLLTIALCHLIYAFTASAILSENMTTRGPNVRTLGIRPSGLQSRLFVRPPHLVQSLQLLSILASDKLATDSPTTLAIGSSVTFGHRLLPENSLTHVIEGMQTDNNVTASLSGLAFDLSAIVTMLEKLVDLQTRADVVFVEIPIANDIDRLATTGSHLLRQEDRRIYVPLEDIRSPFAFFVRTPLGIHLKDRISFVEDNVADERIVNPYVRPPEQYRNGADLIQSRRRDAEDYILRTIQAARSVSDNVILFESPIYATPMGGSVFGEGVDAYRAILHDVCEDENVICLTPSAAFVSNPGNFYNITHLNASGSRGFAAWLLKSARERGVDVQVRDMASLEAYIAEAEEASGMVGGVFPKLAGRFFVRKDDGRETVVYIRGSDDGVDWIAANGLVNTRVTYTANENGTAFKFIRRFADRRRPEQANGRVEYVEDGWREIALMEDGESLFATVRLDPDGEIVREIPGARMVYSPVERATLPPLETD